MSMAIVLTQVRDHLRDTLALAPADCNIRPGGTPPPSPGELYVAIDDAGVASTARDHLSEEYRLEVTLWRRASQVPDDRLGQLALREDPYVAVLVTLDSLERVVVAALHANYALMAAANVAHNLGTPGQGDRFQLALYYTGRGRPETHPPRGASDRPLEWIARRLAFTGLHRTQATDVMT